MIALTEPMGPGRVLTWPAKDPSALLLERAREALQRRRWSIQPECRCATCEAVRARPYHCADCGYTGRPATTRCGCHNELAGHLSFNRITLKQYPSDAEWPKDWKTSRADVVRETALLHRLSVQLETIEACQGEGRGMPVSTAHTFEGNCCHGFVECPACGGYGDRRNDDANLPLAICRDLNAILLPDSAAAAAVTRPTRAGLPLLLAPSASFATAPAPIAPEEEHGDGYVARGLKSELPLEGIDAGPLELVIAEDLYRGERDHASPRQVFVQMYGDDIGGDPAIGLFLTARDLDAVIQQLMVLRDRAHAEGFFDQAELAPGAVA